MKTEDNTHEEKCEDCRGSGMDVDFFRERMERRECPTCHGAGYVWVKNPTKEEVRERYE